MEVNGAFGDDGRGIRGTPLRETAGFQGIRSMPRRQAFQAVFGIFRNYRERIELRVLFRNHFSAAPTCPPDAAALLAGESPHPCGMFGLSHSRTGRGFSLNGCGHHRSDVAATSKYPTCGSLAVAKKLTAALNWRSSEATLLVFRSSSAGLSH